MKKVIAVAVVTVLVVGSSAIGQIQQGENWNLGLTNNMNLSGGPITALTIQGVGTLDGQALGIDPDQNGDPGIVAAEGIASALFQVGAINTGGATTTLVQGLNITGGTLNGQTQLVGDLSGPAAEQQSVNLLGTQNITKGIGSNATVDGLNLAGFGMGQMFENNCAQGGQLSLILGGQFSSIDGAAQSVAIVGTTMSAQIVQAQSANTPEP
jgi:hypothetical protein